MCNTLISYDVYCSSVSVEATTENLIKSHSFTSGYTNVTNFATYSTLSSHSKSTVRLQCNRILITRASRTDLETDFFFLIFFYLTARVHNVLRSTARYRYLKKKKTVRTHGIHNLIPYYNNRPRHEDRTLFTVRCDILLNKHTLISYTIRASYHTHTPPSSHVVSHTLIIMYAPEGRRLCSHTTLYKSSENASRIYV